MARRPENRRILWKPGAAFEPDAAMIRNNLGNLYIETMRYEEGEEMYKSALALQERLAGSDHQSFDYDAATTRQNLANLYADMHRYQESEAMYNSALSVYMRLAGPDKDAYEPEIAMVRNNLGALYHDTGRLKDAEKMYKSALEARQRLALKDPAAFEPEVAMTGENLGNLFFDTGRYDESLSFFLAALPVFERYAEINPIYYERKVASVLKGIASVYRKMQRYDECEKVLSDCLTVCLRMYGREPDLYDISLVDCYMRMGNIMIATGRARDAVDYLGRALDIARTMYSEGKDGTAYVRLLFLLSGISERECDYAGAYAYNGELLNLLKDYYESDPKEWKEEYADKLACQSLYSTLLGKFAEGEQLAREAIGADSSQVIARLDLAAALLLQGKTKEAEKLYRRHRSEYGVVMLEDISEFERLGIIPQERIKDVERIKSMLSSGQ